MDEDQRFGRGWHEWETKKIGERDRRVRLRVRGSSRRWIDAWNMNRGGVKSTGLRASGQGWIAPGRVRASCVHGYVNGG